MLTRRCTGVEAACIAGATVWRPAQAEVEATIAALTANSIRVGEVVMVSNPVPVSIADVGPHARAE